MANPDYIGAYSLMEGDKPVELTVQIKSIKSEQVTGADGKKDMCMVAQLVNQKPFIINATNAKTITKIYDTPYIDDWIGKKITLFVAKIRVAGETIDALRIKPVVPKEQAAPKQKEELTPQHPSWDSAKASVNSGAFTIEQIKGKYNISAENELLITTKPE